MKSKVHRTTKLNDIHITPTFAFIPHKCWADVNKNFTQDVWLENFYKVYIYKYSYSDGYYWRTLGSFSTLSLAESYIQKYRKK